MQRADSRVEHVCQSRWFAACLGHLHIRPTQQISDANEEVNQTAELATRYRKNVQYNLDAIGLLEPSS